MLEPAARPRDNQFRYSIELRGVQLGAAMNAAIAFAMLRAACEEHFGQPVALVSGEQVLAGCG